MKTNYEEFKANMTKLCIAYKYTIPFAILSATYSEYYNSPLGELSMQEFTQLINKAKAVIAVKYGIPQISELIELIPTLKHEEHNPGNYNKCKKCGKTGIVVMIAPDGYEYAFACDCGKGQFRQTQNFEKQDNRNPHYMTCYTKALQHGYKIKTYNNEQLTPNKKKRATKFLNILKNPKTS